MLGKGDFIDRQGSSRSGDWIADNTLVNPVLTTNDDTGSKSETIAQETEAATPGPPIDRRNTLFYE